MSSIVKTPGVCGGRARIDGTRLAVWFVVASHLSVKEFAEEYKVDEKLVLKALKYATKHFEEIDKDLRNQHDRD